MLILVTRETVLMDVTQAAIGRIARDLRLQPSMVTVTWQTDGTLKPQVDIALPPPLPPSELDVSDPVAMARWEQEVADLPGVMDLLRAKGVERPEAVVKHHVGAMLQELVVRFRALGGA
jgi:hypothetical protein